MATIISIFNNKGGVGKTTYLYHVAHLLSRKRNRVLLVDCDSQCNLTSYCLSDRLIRASWKDDGNSIFRAVEPVVKGTGDINRRQPTRVANSKGDLFIVPGDLRLSEFEDTLGDTWTRALGGAEAAIRAQSAIHRYIQALNEKFSFDIIFFDLGPNLGALNRAVLASSDFFITPVAPDLFSIQGTENLGSKLTTWRRQWDQLNTASKPLDISTPSGRPIYLGYVVQMHNIRSTSSGMTKGWGIYGSELETAITKNVVGQLGDDQVFVWDDGNYKLGQIPNLHSLVPYSLDAKKPIFDCTGIDGLRGAHLTKAKESEEHFHKIVETITGVVETMNEV